MKRRRVKITGIGPVTPAGIGREEFWKGILEPVSRVREFTKLGDECGPLVAAQVEGFDVNNFVGDFDVPKGAARHTQFALAATILALRDAGLSMPELQASRCAVISGSSLLDFGGIGSAIDVVQRRGARAAQARVVFTTTLTSITDVINRMCGITSRTMALQTSCCAGLDAVGQASALVASGEVDIAICGGTEAPLHKFPLLELRAAGLTPPSVQMPERLARPFDLWRTSGVVSEGACMFILEPETSPRPAYTYVGGYAFSNDDADTLCGGLLTTGKLAVAEARIRLSDVDCINAWGPGHRIIDQAEADVLISLFGKSLSSIAAVSIKGAVGAALGAAPAIQIAAAALAQRSGVVPPTVNWNFPDPGCPLNLGKQSRSIEHDCTLVNAHGVGSVNASMVLQRC
jgi:3-oxoacyl-[acyl-carrier-protein] synthase II